MMKLISLIIIVVAALFVLSMAIQHPGFARLPSNCGLNYSDNQNCYCDKGYERVQINQVNEPLAFKCVPITNNI